MTSGYHAVGTPTAALVSDATTIKTSNNARYSNDIGTLRIDGRDAPKPIFLGVGPRAAVDAYLAAVAHDEVTDIASGPFQFVTRRVNGGQTVAPPSDQTFWLASNTGVNPDLMWKFANGDYRVVAMNADGSPGVAADLRFAIKVPALFGISLAATIIGSLLSLLGLGLFIWGIAAKRRRLPPAGQPVGYQPATGRPLAYPAPNYPSHPTNPPSSQAP